MSDHAKNKNPSTKVSNYKITLSKGRQKIYMQTLPYVYTAFSAQQCFSYGTKNLLVWKIKNFKCYFKAIYS